MLQQLFGYQNVVSDNAKILILKQITTFSGNLFPIDSCV